MEKYVLMPQNKICFSLEKFDDVKFFEDNWIHEEGGGGKTRVIQNGKFFEKDGVNILSVSGILPDEIAAKFKVEKMDFGAYGISLVIHFYSPKIPTIHMNVRYFELGNDKCWFGGGIDLAPYFPYPEGFKLFHLVIKEACEKIIPGSYKEFKKECDEYFSIRQRNEMCGIGGIFSDYKDETDERYFTLVKSVGDFFLNSYLPLLEKRKLETFSEEDKQFQLIRRGRFVEFNLIYDRGTLS